MKPASMRDDIAEIIIGEEELQARVKELGQALSRDYQGRCPMLVGVLKGTAFFFADLMRALTIPATADFIAVSNYGPSTEASGVVRFLKDLDQPIEGRHVMMVEDIIDTGLTLNYILRNLWARRPVSLEVCTLLNKPAHRLVKIPLKYIGFDLPDLFVVGYGLDYMQRYRNLPFIGTLKPQVYGE